MDNSPIRFSFLIVKKHVMHIHHLAIWVDDLERAKHFYTLYFKGIASAKYRNEKKGFTSYFIRFEQGAELELMRMDGLDDCPTLQRGLSLGLAHFAFGLESNQAVDDLTNRFRRDGYTVAGEPRTTGDGCYESVVLDSEGNRLELVSLIAVV